jgi:hypothetical protein
LHFLSLILPDVLTLLDGAVGAVGAVVGVVGGAEGPLLGAPGAGAGETTGGAGVDTGKFFSAHPLGIRPIGNIHVAVNITPYPIAGAN